MMSIIYDFECSCSACTNEKFHQMSFARYNPSAMATLLSVAPKSLKDAVNEFKKNAESLKKCFKHHPSHETANLQFKNYVLIHIIEKYATIHFAMRDTL